MNAAITGRKKKTKITSSDGPRKSINALSFVFDFISLILSEANAEGIPSGESPINTC